MNIDECPREEANAALSKLKKVFNIIFVLNEIFMIQETFFILV